MRTAEQLVSAEVIYYVSHLVSALANGCDGIAPEKPQLIEMCEQAFELCSPIDDWEEAAIQAGWSVGKTQFGEPCFVAVVEPDAGLISSAPVGDWKNLCFRENIDPYEREVFEHWIVSNWLAEKLAAKGEKVDTDFAGLTVWARTTTGQSISMDSVIVDIVADLAREYGE